MKQFNGGKRQKGNYLLSIMVGIMVVTLLSIWGVPKIKDMITEGAVTTVTDDLKMFITRTVTLTRGTGTTPYTGIDQAYLARGLRGTSLQVGVVAGEGTAGTDVRHGLGGDVNGTVILAQTGTQFTLTFAQMNLAACIPFTSSMNKTVDGITINGAAVKVTDVNKTITTAFRAAAAQAQCTDGDTNTVILTIR